MNLIKTQKYVHKYYKNICIENIKIKLKKKLHNIHFKIRIANLQKNIKYEYKV